MPQPAYQSSAKSDNLWLSYFQRGCHPPYSTDQRSFYGHCRPTTHQPTNVQQNRTMCDRVIDGSTNFHGPFFRRSPM